MYKGMVVIAMDLTFSAPCPECGSEAEWSQAPPLFVMGSVGQYGYSSEWVVHCNQCGLQLRDPSPSVVP